MPPVPHRSNRVRPGSAPFSSTCTSHCSKAIWGSPASAIGDVTSDLATRRARINGQDTLPGGRAEISALVPLSELQDYLSRLKALTGGEGTYTMDLSHYDPVPARRHQELVAAFKPREEAD